MSYRYPDSIEIRFKNNNPENNVETLLQLGNSTSTNLILELHRTGNYPTQGNINLYIRSGSDYISSSLTGSHLFDGEFNQLFLERTEYNDNSDIDQSYSIHLVKQKNGVVTFNNFSTITINASGGGPDTSYNDSWTVDNTLYIGYANNSKNINYFSGEIQEVRYWHQKLSDEAKIQHCLNGESYSGNTPTSSFYDLLTKIPLNDVDVNLESNTYINSINPDRKSTTTYDGEINRARIYNLQNSDYISYQEEYNQTIPSYGPNIYDSNKVEFVSTSLDGFLNTEKRVERSIRERYELASNKARIALTPTDIINTDIFSHTGYFAIDDYIGNPEDINNDKYTDLENFTKEYWKKYSSINSFDAYFNILRLFDYSLFQQIKQVLPARGDYQLGVLYEPTVLERSKQRLYKNATNDLYTQPTSLKISPNELEFIYKLPYEDSINIFQNEIDGIIKEYNSSIENNIPKKIGGSLTYKFYLDYGKITPNSSKYQRTISNYSDGSFNLVNNSDDISQGLFELIESYNIENEFYQTKKYFYNNDDDIYNGIYSLYQYESSDIRKPVNKGEINNRFDGCKLINIPNKNNLYPTPDGKPVIEEYYVEYDSFTENEDIDNGNSEI